MICVCATCCFSHNFLETPQTSLRLAPTGSKWAACESAGTPFGTQCGDSRWVWKTGWWRRVDEDEEDENAEDEDGGWLQVAAKDKAAASQFHISLDRSAEDMRRSDFLLNGSSFESLNRVRADDEDWGWWWGQMMMRRMMTHDDSRCWLSMWKKTTVFYYEMSSVLFEMDLTKASTRASSLRVINFFKEFQQDVCWEDRCEHNLDLFKVMLYFVHGQILHLPFFPNIHRTCFVFLSWIFRVFYIQVVVHRIELTWNCIRSFLKFWSFAGCTPLKTSIVTLRNSGWKPMLSYWHGPFLGDIRWLFMSCSLALMHGFLGLGEQWKRVPGWLGYIGDDILHFYLVLSHCRGPY